MNDRPPPAPFITFDVGTDVGDQLRRPIGVQDRHSCRTNAAGALDQVDELRGSDSWRS
jgi:hypothetical protein